MAFTDINKYLGGYASGFYKYTRPQLSVSYKGVKNNGGKIGFRGGLIGNATQYVSPDTTYNSLNMPNYILTISQNESSEPGIYVNYINSNYGIIGTPQGLTEENRVNGNLGIFDTYNKLSPPKGIGDIVASGPFEEWIIDNGLKVTGKKVNFYLEITANCPIIKLENYQYLSIDGTMKRISRETVIEDVAPSWILNSGFPSGEDVTQKYYINNTWTTEKDSVTTKKILEITTKKKSSLCLYVDENNTSEYDTRLYDLNENFTIINYIENGEGGQVPELTENMRKYTYLSKLNVVSVSVFNTNIPIFNDLNNVSNYLALVLDDADTTDFIIKNALNPDNVITQTSDTANSGISIGETPLETGYSRNVFNKMFALDFPAINEISGNIFNADTSVQSALLDGLKLYGANPMDCIIDLTYYPFDVKSVVKTTSQKNIFFGSYKMDLENDVNFLGQPRCVINMGRVIYTPVFNDFRDFEPYTQFYIYLPYIGVNKLDISNYYKKAMELQYIIDFTSGTCIAVILADNIIADSFAGTIGVKQSISSIDYNAYSQNVARNISNDVKSAVGGFFTPAVKDILNGGNLKNAAGGFLDFEANIFETNQSLNSQKITIRSNGSPSASMCMPQYAFTYCIYNKQVRPENEKDIVGLPTNKGGKVKDFNGFLKCSKVSLKSTCTVHEKKKIYELLQSGIYI